MKFTKIALSLLAVIGSGCATAPPATTVSRFDLPNCFDTNYNSEKSLFTIKGGAERVVNQKCLLLVGSQNSDSQASRLRAGRYAISVANGGGGGAGGTIQTHSLVTGGSGGGGGGGGAGAVESQSTLNLAEGAYILTIGAGGPGGSGCTPPPNAFSGGPGWAGSPTNMVNASTGELTAGVPGAEKYARLSRAANDRAGGKPDGHGGSGPGQTEGGDAGLTQNIGGAQVIAESGDSKRIGANVGVGGAAGTVPSDDKRAGAGGGGGATSRGDGGKGGGELPKQVNVDPNRGALGSGGGGGAGNTAECDAGARGGHGFIALRPV